MKLKLTILFQSISAGSHLKSIQIVHSKQVIFFSHKYLLIDFRHKMSKRTYVHTNVIIKIYNFKKFGVTFLKLIKLRKR